VSLADQPGEDLGTEMYDGEPARVIRTAVPQELGQEGRMTVWISIRTGLPLKLSVPRGDRSPGQFIEFTDFAFDAEYDPADFSLDVPPGYEARPPMDDPEVALKNASIQARNIFMAVAIYQQKYGEWPARLDQLVQSAVLDAGGLENPRLPELDQGFLYFPPTVDFDPQAGVLFEPIAEWRGVGVIAYADGHVEVQADRARYNELLLAAMARGQPGNGPR